MSNSIQTNPSSPESIHSSSSSSSNHLQTSHHKRKFSSTLNSNSSLSLKDQKQSISSDQSTPVQHTHHPQSNGLAISKRKEQNRNAQRAFRERKEKKLQELQDQVDELIAKQEPLTNENKHLKELVNKLQTENHSLAVYKDAFTFTISNDLRKSSMSISNSFDQLHSISSSSSSPSSPSSSSSSNLNHQLDPLNSGNQENSNRLALSLSTSDHLNHLNHHSISNPSRIIQKPTHHQTPRNTISNRTTHQGYTPPLSSSSSLASFLNTNQTPMENFDQQNRSLNPSKRLDSSFPIYSMPRNPNLTFNVDQSDPILDLKQFDHTNLNSLPTFDTSDHLTSSILNFDKLLPSNDTHSILPESDTTFWNSYLNFESTHDKLNRSEEINSIEKIQSNEVSLKSNHQFGLFNNQERSFPEFDTKDKTLSDLIIPLKNESLNSFTQWRSNDQESIKIQQEDLYPIFGINSLNENPNDDKQNLKLINSEERNSKSLIKFVNEGILSNQELDGLCEMLKSKATCKEKSELMKDVIAIRPDWIELIEDLTKQVKSKSREGLNSLKQDENEK